ncbi:hypothetical protein Hokovirus_2_234 [Hokovirus HKV1]|uniref:Uncharacterized protein n=1 Tax=Hokovirus HKV1 TaxID=1977638 RepID=A0A1V0SG64_9VIRU|nr:hypothetical protein Hokovirus_2_234 [Hokovirus HKV1]
MIILILILFSLIIFIIYYLNKYEYFYPYTVSTRNTRNMSYDIRGDIPINPTYVGPWLNSDIYNFDYGNNYVRDNGTVLFL